MNSSRDLDNRVYKIDSLFESRYNSRFNAFNGPSTLEISNKSSLSGRWRGSFNIESDAARVVSGARFKPEGGRIVIGK
jgi:hypothetical protein